MILRVSSDTPARVRIHVDGVDYGPYCGRMACRGGCGLPHAHAAGGYRLTSAISAVGPVLDRTNVPPDAWSVDLLPLVGADGIELLRSMYWM